MSDVFNVVGTWDKASYNPGDTITGTISGNDVQTTTTPVQEIVGVSLLAANGATTTYTFPPVTVNTVVATPESVVIDTTQPIVDSSGHTWQVSPNKLSITRTA
jgi:hypothetical protein